MIPYLVIIVLSIIGYIYFGILGTFIGAGAGYILNLLLGLLSSQLKVNPYKKEQIIPLVSRFIEMNFDKILLIDKYKSMELQMLQEIFFKYIAQIHNSAIKLDNPVKKHPGDLNYAYYRDNFVQGGLVWADSFTDKNESNLLKEYVLFSEKYLYDRF